MRLWHYKLIPFLDDQRLLGQHRECCALRGLGWGRKHSIVDYVFKHSIAKLWAYHMDVMLEMNRRGFKIDAEWLNVCYRGKNCKAIKTLIFEESEEFVPYQEHNMRYLFVCIKLLYDKDPVFYKKLADQIPWLRFCI